MSASGARLERNQGQQGQAPAIISPEIDSLESSVTSRSLFASFFSFDAIVRQLVKWRVRAMTRRREDAFYAAHLDGLPQPEEAVACEAAKYLPPRNLWKRPRAADRKHHSAEQITMQSILRTVRGFRNSGHLTDTCWGKELCQLVTRITTRIGSDDFQFGTPKVFLKRKNKKEYRALAVYGDIEDRLILSGTAAYLRNRFDPLLSSHCHSFRVNHKKSHQSAVAELITYRRAHIGETLYVAECDIKKFFDVVDHREALKVFDAFASKCDADAEVRKVVKAYLSSYYFNGAMKQAEDYIPKDKLRKVVRVKKNDLMTLYPGENVRKLRLGLPQGGALSPLFANILLATADTAVVKDEADPNLLYIRFCDDMIIVHTDQTKCNAAMRRYLTAVKRRKLPVHEKKRVIYNEGYYGLKTKGPFEWREASIGARNAAPWVSFLGYQINYKGETRIRKETIQKHLRNLKKERVQFERRLQNVHDAGTRDILVRHYKTHLMAKGVGFLKSGNIQENSLCWVGAFPNLRGLASADCQLQMRRIDAFRDRMMFFADRKRTGSHTYYGRPFSYYGYLLRQPRPGKHRKLICSFPFEWDDFNFYAQL